ncbi:MAG TPA: hypothetical protein PKY30_23120 [Myxococcota bacterium]|nr:hypothetical protein [Myxococcota bacterium]HND31063.1 hypothetical protein [Myxococcota bacterium]HNH49954.1 hypothetical protein [Myxococcota bacterium]
MLLWLLACGGPPVELEFSPDPLDFGEVPYTSDMPEGGFAQKELSITNIGEEEFNLSLAAHDEAWFCVEGIPDTNEVTELGLLNPGSTYLLQVGICDHAPGTFDSDQELELAFLTDGEPVRFALKVLIHPMLVVE